MPTSDLTRRLFLGSLGATLALPEIRAMAQGAAPAAPAPAANVEKNVVYGKGGDTDLHLDIYKPTGAANKRMAVIHFHGGGFGGGKKDGLPARPQTLSAPGYLNIAAPNRPSRLAKVPAHMADGKAAHRRTRANTHHAPKHPA